MAMSDAVYYILKRENHDARVANIHTTTQCHRSEREGKKGPRASNLQDLASSSSAALRIPYRFPEAYSIPYLLHTGHQRCSTPTARCEENVTYPSRDKQSALRASQFVRPGLSPLQIVGEGVV